MLKYSLILLGAYFLYYAGNIVYDLFLKKDKIVHTDATEEFSLADFAQSESLPPSSIEIEDVENIRTPKSFLKSKIPISQVQNTFQENPDLEVLRRRFESEQDIDGFDNDEEPVKNTTENTEVIQSKNNENYQNHIQEEPASSIQKSNKNKWYQLLNLAETSVQMISHNDGYKIYHSIM
ncbi:hypothetical protein H9Q08_05525 [Chryseobacterium sp. PS-8]|uniref:Uncharacterized protein n=1 Tax=Chryseobacterium indicum TaxID=2766954 RepID=A0ABS9C4P2_9FLAO|nr:hypothetical protein [Chryseobacterium sp. PS-8]MCF2218758.1 hypothetical protein [Chryseobacterium sp. PS-8]